MLPENEDLRKRHAPLKDFVAGTFRTPLLFTPGTQVKYQSMGILLASEIIERITKRPLPDFLREQVYAPLGMRRDIAGSGRPADCGYDALPGSGQYGLELEQSLLAESGSAMGRSPFECGRRDAAAAVLRQARQPRSQACNGESYGHESERGSESAVWNRLGIAGSEFGHGGSTGTLCWFDPQKNLSFVLLTTKPAAESQKTVLTPASDLVIEATKS